TAIAPTTLTESLAGVSNEPDGGAVLPAVICFMCTVAVLDVDASALITVRVASALPEPGSPALSMDTVKAPLPVPEAMETCSHGWFAVTVQLRVPPPICVT